MPLRSNFEPGTSRWATRRAQWRALGLTDEDMTKPKIAIVNSSSQLAICFSHLDEIARRARRAVEQAGGVVFEVRTAAPSDFITSAGHRGGYILSSRDLITNDIEVAVEGALLDGMLCLASCDKTAPGQLMAAARLNIPSVIVACGYQPSGTYRGRHCDIEDVFLAAGHVANGKLTVAELTEMSEHAVLGPGVCAGMGTANTMHLACEALGMALPGTTPVRANSEPMWRAVEQAARRVVEMTAEDLRAARHPHPGRLRQRGDGRPVGQRLDQLGQAPAGRRGRSRVRRRRVPAVRGPGRPGAAAGRGPAQRRGADRGVRGRRRRPRGDEAARAAPGRRPGPSPRRRGDLRPTRAQRRRPVGGSARADAGARTPAALPELSAADNIVLGCYCWTSSLWKARHSRPFGLALELFPEIGPHLGQPAGTLSGGQQQMVAIMRGLASDPKILAVTNPAWAWPSRSAGGCTTRWPGSTRPRTTLVVVEEAPKRALVIYDRSDRGPQRRGARDGRCGELREHLPGPRGHGDHRPGRRRGPLRRDEDEVIG